MSTKLVDLPLLPDPDRSSTNRGVDITIGLTCPSAYAYDEMIIDRAALEKLAKLKRTSVSGMIDQLIASEIAKYETYEELYGAPVAEDREAYDLGDLSQEMLTEILNYVPPTGVDDEERASSDPRSSSSAEGVQGGDPSPRFKRSIEDLS